MSKVKYDLKKVLLFPLAYYILITLYLFFIKEGILNYSFFLGFIVLTLVMIIVFIMFWKTYREENNRVTGLYFSLTECWFVQSEKIDKFAWSEVRAKSTLKIWNFFHVIRFSSSNSDFTYYTFLFFPVSESFITLVRAYVPKEHELHKLIRNYRGED